MSSADLKPLRKILDKGGRTDLAGAGKLTKVAAQALEAAGYVRVVPDGRKVALELTDAGRAAAESYVEPPRRAARPKAPDLLAGLHDKLDDVLRRLGRIEAQLAPGPPAARDLPAVKRALMDTIAELDAVHRYGGLVPIPDIRRALRHIPAATVTAALEDLEKDYAIDLSIAQASTAVPDRAAGIERPGRGLLYYVARRTS